MIVIKSVPMFFLKCAGTNCRSRGPVAATEEEAGRLAQEAGWSVTSVWTKPLPVGDDWCPSCAAKQREAQPCTA